MESIKLGKIVLLLLIVTALLPIVAAVTFTDDTEPQAIFRQGSEASIIDVCTDVDDTPCDALFQCNLTVSYPNTTIMVNNQQMTHNADFYNYTLPNTNTLGVHSYVIFCQNGTNAGAASELSYLINLTGEDFTTSKSILYIFVLLITMVLMLLALYGAVRIPFKNKKDDQGFIVGMNDMKYVKILLWFVTYLLLLFSTWLTANVSRFLELGQAANFFDFAYLSLLVMIFPLFIILFLTGFANFFNDKKLSKLMDRNIRVR